MVRSGLAIGSGVSAHSRGLAKVGACEASVQPCELPNRQNASRYVPALDGLRAASITLVILAHCGLDRILPGAFGVTLFFFISGLLITRQLLSALVSKGRIGLGGFYLRRALRLVPAGLLYVALSGTIFSVAGGYISFAGWASASGYGANFYDLWAGYRSNLAGVRHPFNILWSLAIEEHFYLVWPLALAMLWRWRIALPASLVLCTAVLAWRFFLFGHCAGDPLPGVCGLAQENPLWHYKRLYLGTDTRCDSILWGAVLACAERAAPAFMASAARSRGLAALALLLLAASFASSSPLWRDVLRTSLQGAALVVLVPACLNAGSLVQSLLSASPAIVVGRLSYSLYLWHWGAFAVADACWPGSPFRLALIGLPLGALLAAFSYWGVERPMLRLRRKAGSHAPTDMLTARKPTDAASEIVHGVSRA